MRREDCIRQALHWILVWSVGSSMAQWIWCSARDWEFANSVPTPGSSSVRETALLYPGRNAGFNYPAWKDSVITILYYKISVTLASSSCNFWMLAAWGMECEPFVSQYNVCLIELKRSMFMHSLMVFLYSIQVVYLPICERWKLSHRHSIFINSFE